MILSGGGGANDKSGREDVDLDKKSKKIILPITGFLTIIGGVCWIWYGMGDLSHGSEMDNKIFKSIAILYLENLSGDQKDENICTGLTSSITTAFSRLGIFDIKPRTDVLKFKNKITTAGEINSVLGVDAYIEGSLIRSPNSNEYIANITLVDALGGKNLWAKEFKKTSGDILNIPNIIVKEVTQFLSGDVVANIAPIYDAHQKSADETLPLLGQGINLLDSGDYSKSLTVFDSILVKEPDNRLAVFSKGQALEGLTEYQKAILIYKKLLPEDDQNIRTRQIWTHPDFTGNYKRDLRVRGEIINSDGLNMLIIAIKNSSAKTFEIAVVDLNTNMLVWDKTFSLQQSTFKVVGRNLVITGSSLSADENATVYVYDLQSRNLLMSKEFVRDHATQRMILSVVENHASHSPKFKNAVFLYLRRDDYYNIVLLDPEKGVERWREKFPLQTVQEGDPKIYLVESSGDYYFFHQKGINLYLYSAEDGEHVWTKTLSDNGGRVLLHEDRLILYSNSNAIVKIENIITQKNIGQFELGSNPDGRAGIINDNIIINTKTSVTSLKTEKPFLRSLENWTVKIDAHDHIGRGDLIFGVADNMFVFTQSGDLYCINPHNGRVININKLDANEDAAFIRDETSKSFVLYANGFLVGLDPHNGKTLWKIRETNITNPKNHLQLIDNRLIVVRRVNNHIIIKAYARTTGDLLWVSNEKIWPNNSNQDIGFLNLDKGKEYYIEVKKNISGNAEDLYIGTRWNGLYSIDLAWNPDKNYIPTADLYNHLASCYNKIEEYTESEQLLIHVIDVIDQQNEGALTQLSDMYLQKDDIQSFVDIQSKFYELILYDDIKRGRVEGLLMKHAGLRWVQPHLNHDVAIELQEQNILIVGGCGKWRGDTGCTMSAFRQNSGINLWNENYNFTGIKGLYASNDQFCFVSWTRPDEKKGRENHNYTFYGLNGRSGKTIFETTLWENKEAYHTDKIYYFDSAYIVDAHSDQIRYITALNSETGEPLWREEFSKNSFLQGKPVDIIRRDSLIIIPGEENLKAVNLYSGSLVWTYDYFDDFEDIEYLNQEGLYGETLSLVSGDDEFVVLDLQNPGVIFQEDIEFDQNVHIVYQDHKYLLGYNDNLLILFKKSGNKIVKVWKNTNQNIDIPVVLEEQIYRKTLSEDNSIVEIISLLNGKRTAFVQQIWDGSVCSTCPSYYNTDVVFAGDGALSFFNGKKLYHINY